MKFDLSEDQELLRNATADFMSKSCALESTRELAETDGEGFSRKEWAGLAELGYLGLLSSEQSGGMGLGAVELAIVCHEMGRVVFPGPYLDVLLASRILDGAGGAAEVVEAMAVGNEIVVLAHVDRVWPNQPGEIAYGDGHVDGTAYFVPYGASADRLLVVAGDDLVLADGPFESAPMESVEEMTRFAEIKLDNPARRIGAASLVEGVRDLGAVGAAAHALGLCESAMQRTIEYSRQRETFGKPIGTYQALQHRIADMLVKSESSRSVVYHAAWSVQAGAGDAARVAAAARAYAVGSARSIGEEAIQIHGGNGFTWEYDVHCFLKRALTLEHHPASHAHAVERALAQFEAVS